MLHGAAENLDGFQNEIIVKTSGFSAAFCIINFYVYYSFFILCTEPCAHMPTKYFRSW